MKTEAVKISFSEKVKQEILKNKPLEPCCMIAGLSAYARSCGSIFTKGGKVGFSLSSENADCIDYFVSVVNNIYGELPFNKDYKSKDKHRVKAEFLSDNTLGVLVDLGILHIEEGHVTIRLDIDPYLTENVCCKKAYVLGAFLGSGSVTVPEKSNSTTGYHLEFVFSKYATATDFCQLLAQFEFSPGLIERNASYVVYLNGAGEVADVLGLLNANKACLDVNTLIVEREVKNNTNRVINCEISNINKQINASILHRNAIEDIDKTLGLDNLPTQLKIVAKARIEFPEDTLTELSQRLGITKSCLNHRLRKILEIHKNI